MTRPVTKTARQALVAELIEKGEIHSQTELAERLATHGIEVTQPTLSKDLLGLGAVRVHGVYQLVDREPVTSTWGNLAKQCAELLISAVSSGNVAILKTPPGAAQFLASALDRVGWTAVLGTIAGDDTIAVYAADPNGGAAISTKLRELSEK